MLETPNFFLTFVVAFTSRYLIVDACDFCFMQIRKSQHAFINPSVTIILRMGAGGHGVPPLGSRDG